jgi:chemotaxis protein CheD
MPVAEAITNVRPPFVGMGQLMTVAKPARLCSVVGSCIAVCIYHPRFQVGAMAHVVLPDAVGHVGSEGKFADSAVPALLREMTRLTDMRAGFVAKLAGGANMFAATGPLQIGALNIAAVKKFLAEAQVRVLAESLGGTQGRRIEFDPADGSLSIEIQGQPTTIL